MAARCITNTQRNHISLIQLRVINSAASDLKAVNVCVCVRARFCACVWWASLHMSNWAVPGPRHSSVPQHKASWWGHLLLTVRRSRSPSQQLPRGQTVWAQTPGGTEHGYELSKHTTWSYISSSEYRSHTSPCFCKYLTVREKTPL